MNVNAYIELSNMLAGLERDFALNEQINNLLNTLNQLATSPADQNIQKSVADSLEKLESSFESALGEVTPADFKRIEEIGGKDFYSLDTIRSFRSELVKNSATPAAAAQYVQAQLNERQEFQKQLNTARKSLSYFGFDGDHESDDLASQVGFTFPREMFSNDLNGLIKELSFVKLLINQIAEASGLEDEPIEIGQISTSDPLFWLIVSVILGKQIGSCVSWALDQWKKVEEIKQARAITLQTEAFTAIEINKFFDGKITKQLDVELDKKTTELMSSYKGPDPRKNELFNGLKLALKKLLARIEKGMTVQLKLLEPPIYEDEENNEAGEEKREKLREDFRYLAQCLVFPPPADNPVLQIPEDSDDTKNGSS